MKLLARIALVPVTFLAALLTIFLAIANRHTVSFSFDPFDIEAPALALDLPLFAIVLVSIFIGILIGGGSAWMGQRQWRKTAREKRAALARIEKTQTAGLAATTPDKTALVPTQANGELKSK